jgi:hypothetical protein
MRMMTSRVKANTGLAILVLIVVVVAFTGYRFTQYGQFSAPGAGEPVRADQKPPDAYKQRPN